MRRFRPSLEILNEGGASDIILLCEHASNYIPRAYNGLGLTKFERESHIAWDLGAANVTRCLSSLIDAPAYLGTFSRLLIDLNRPLSSSSSIVTRPEATEVPGNLDLTSREKAWRIEHIFLPFHDHLTKTLDHRQKVGRKVRLVSVHSFTPVFLGRDRHWQAGVLFGAAADFGNALVKNLRHFEVVVDANVPYQSSREEDFTVPIHGDDRNIPAVLVEIRNDLIVKPEQVADWVKRLAVSLV